MPRSRSYQTDYCGLTVLVEGRHMTFEHIIGTDGEPLVVSFHMEVCGACSGSGTTTAHIECEGGGFTASEWNEMCDGDPDFADDYFSGVYDRPCPSCKGQNVKPAPDIDSLDEEDRHILESALEDERQYRAMVASERRMGC